MLDKCVKSQRKNFYIVLFCKVKLNKMASIKTNKIEKQTPLPKTNFLRYATLLLRPKRFVHSKGPKNGICLFLWSGKLHDLANKT